MIEPGMMIRMVELLNSVWMGGSKTQNGRVQWPQRASCTRIREGLSIGVGADDFTAGDGAEARTRSPH